MLSDKMLTIQKLLLRLSLLFFLGIGSFLLWKNQSLEKTSYKSEIDVKALAQAKKLEKYLAMSPEELAKLPKQDKPDLGMLHYFEMTKDPNLGYIPAERRLEVFQGVQTMARQRRLAKAINNVVWKERGPNNIGGRTRALTFDPNDSNRKKVWAGAVSGGLWYNNDITSASSTWQNVNDFWANIAISCITFDPMDSKVMYVGTGEGYFSWLFIDTGTQGAGIWKTTDGGITWNQLASTKNSDFTYVNKIEITPSGKIFAGTHAGVFISSNGGNSWTRKVNGKVADIEISNDGNTIYASTGVVSETGRMYKSTDGGNSWNIITPATGCTRIEMAISKGNNNVLYAMASGGGTSGHDISWFKKTTDGGTTWQDVIIPRYQDRNCTTTQSDFTRGQAWYDLAIEVHPSNSNLVLIGGIDIHRTMDGGNSWELLSYWEPASNCGQDYAHADQHVIKFRPNDVNTAIFGHDGGVSYSSNIWASDPTISNRVNGYNVTQFYGVDMSNISNSNYMLAGAQDNGTIKINSTNIGTSVRVTGGDGIIPHIDANNSNFQITASQFNYYELSTDGGVSFRPFFASNDGRFVNPTDFDDATNILYVAAAANQYIPISNIGSTNQISTPVFINALGGRQISAIKVSPHTSNRIFIADDLGKVIRVDNAHTSSPSVTLISKSNIPTGYISNIELGANDNEILITLSNYGLTSVFETTNGGATWSNKEGNLPDFPVYSALYNPANRNQVLLATETGVWSCDNFRSSSPSWGLSTTGLANVRCTMLKYRSSDKVVAVATFGRGIFTSDVFKSPATLPSDIAGNWAENEIAFMVGNGYMAGYSDGTFKPDNYLSRAEFATMIVKVINPPAKPNIPTPSFSDVPSTHWAKENIEKAVRAGYLAGFTDGTFKPDDKVTKVQINVAIANGLGLSGGTSSMLDLFTDKNDIPNWARTSVANAVANRFVANHSDKNYYRPNWSSTRANAVVVVYQALRYLHRASDLYNYYLIVPANPVSKNTSLAENNESSFKEFRVYPNPTSAELMIQTEAIQDKNATIEIYELSTGRRVMQEPYAKNAKLSVAHLNRGNYLLKIIHTEGILSKKFIKQ